MYVQRYAVLYTWDEFVALNLQVCQQLQDEADSIASAVR